MKIHWVRCSHGLPLAQRVGGSDLSSAFLGSSMDTTHPAGPRSFLESLMVSIRTTPSSYRVSSKKVHHICDLFKQSQNVMCLVNMIATVI